MHKRYPTVLAALVATVVLAACDRRADEGVADEVTDRNTPGPAAAEPAPVQTEGNPGVPPSVDTVTDTTLMVATAGTSQPYVADSAGSALYTLEGETDGSACDDACQQAWPPLLVEGGAPSPGPRLQPTMVGTLSREDGAVQVTYNGHPLYRYAADTGTGRTAGHGVQDQWGHWYLVGPQGDLLPEDAVQQGDAATSGEESPSGEIPQEPGT